jgi:chromosomal replication initiation ATPase DnaA
MKNYQITSSTSQHQNQEKTKLKYPFAFQSLRKIAVACCDYYQVEPKALTGPCRLRELVIPRSVCMNLMRDLTWHSLGSIGKFFQGRDHTTVIYHTKSKETKNGLWNKNNALGQKIWNDFETIRNIIK